MAASGRSKGVVFVGSGYAFVTLDNVILPSLSNWFQDHRAFLHSEALKGVSVRNLLGVQVGLATALAEVPVDRLWQPSSWIWSLRLSENGSGQGYRSPGLDQARNPLSG